MKRLLGCALSTFSLLAQSGLPNHGPLVDAHNCYPYEGRYRDRIDRALRVGFPVGIEQDLAWGVDPAVRDVLSFLTRRKRQAPSPASASIFSNECVRS